MAAPDRPWKPILVRGIAGASSFDAREIIGLTEAEGQALAGRHGCRMRVLSKDGRRLVRTNDLKPHRINVALTNDVIVEVLGVS